jgi:hypothetical protein
MPTPSGCCTSQGDPRSVRRYLRDVPPRVFRGIGIARGAARIAALVTVYAGAFGILWGLGLAVRGWQGWMIVGAPLAGMIATRVWVWHRVSVEVAHGRLRSEGALPQRDFEVGLDDNAAPYFDASLPSRPLVLALRDGDERFVGELSPKSARALYRHLREHGVPPLRALRAEQSSSSRHLELRSHEASGARD